ncbi:hypothetical protein EOS_33545 [Caballeronia mineralivorans PML1(12)]|uniref:Uncharacterized protein n=1 Tax=Caballeronia mineralivorans PML1(12) TaxID=908627 RepID=A0A0J1CM97_9BURK|nr:hypothetical protein EOS_33545 [Caballeronia mineralivorans PML1(12)]
MKCAVKMAQAEDTTLQKLLLNHKHSDIPIQSVGVVLPGLKVKLIEFAPKPELARTIGLRLAARPA